MIIPGYWSPVGYPAVLARLECRYPYARGFIEFALDTGSPFTILSQMDAERLKIAYSKMDKPPAPIAVGGFEGAVYIMKEVNLWFRESKHTEKLESIYVIPEKNELQGIIPLPSILGRNFLNKYNVIFEKGQGSIIITDQSFQLLA